MTLITIYWGLVFLNILAFLTGKQYKLLSAVTSFFLILFVMGKRPVGTNIGADYDYYQRAYENNEYFSVDFGFILINKIGRFFSLSFDTFYMVLIAAIIIVLILSVIKIGGNLHLFLASYLIYFDIVAIDLIRNQCAIALLVIAVFVPLYERRKYLLGLLLSSSFHISYLSYIIPFYLCRRDEHHKLKRAVNTGLVTLGKMNDKSGLKKAQSWMAIMLFIFAFFFFTGTVNLITPILSFIISFLGSAQDRYARYLLTNARMSVLIPLFVYIVLVCGLNYWKKSVQQLTINRERIDFYANYIYQFSLYCSVFLILTFFSIHCYRFIRDLTLIGIIFMGVNSTGKTSRLSGRLVILAITVIICFSWFYFDVIMKDYFTDYVATFYINELLVF